MNQTDENVSSIKGFFVIMDEDERRLLINSMKVDTGRSGIFYQKNELVTTLETRIQNLKEKVLHIVEISVPHCCIINPNCQKFGIKKGDVKIIQIQPFEEAQQEIRMQA